MARKLSYLLLLLIPGVVAAQEAISRGRDAARPPIEANAGQSVNPPPAAYAAMGDAANGAVARDARTEAQERPKGRLRIGVALEGGGALGLAHVGVLQWFEEHHIPVDYVAGTSMGGLLGGFYATGMSPSECPRAATSTRWAPTPPTHGNWTMPPCARPASSSRNGAPPSLKRGIW